MMQVAPHIAVQAEKSRLRFADVGTQEALAFLRRHHPAFALAGDDIFAFAVKWGGIVLGYVIVTERDGALGHGDIHSTGVLRLSADRLATVQVITELEAKLCGIKPPFNATLITRTGALTVGKPTTAIKIDFEQEARG